MSYYLITFLKQCLFCIIFIGWSYAQNPNGFEHISTEDGLSQSDVNCIYQDHQGFMWFGTHDGLNKYDGYKFTVFYPEQNNQNSIGSNLIWDIEDAKNGNLWIGTTGSGLDYFDKSTEKFTHFRHNEKDKHSLISDYISKLYKDKKNRLWIATSKGLDMIDLNKSLESIKFDHFNPYENEIFSTWDGNTLYSIFEDRNNQLWVGGLKGISKLSRDKNGHIYFQLMNAFIGLPEVLVKTITEDDFGRLIIGTFDGLYLITPMANSMDARKIMEGNFNEVKAYKNQLWAGTDDGLSYFDNSSKDQAPSLINHFKNNPKNPKNSLSMNNVKSLFIDNTGIVWVGANGGGVNKFDPDRKKFKHIKNTLEKGSLSAGKVRSLFEDSNGSLWVGTEGGGLNMLTKNDVGNFSKFKNMGVTLKPVVITEVKTGVRKKLLIGSETSPGLYELDITNPEKIEESGIKEIQEIKNSVFSILEDSHKNIWIGTYSGGVRRWLVADNKTGYKKDILSENSNQASSISNNIIRNIFEDNIGNIWFGTANGLCKLLPEEIDKKNPKFIVYKNIPNDASSLSHNYVLNIFQSHSGDIWIGTLGGGLNRFIPAGNGESEGFKWYSEKNGLANNVIKSILEDNEHNLWLSTNKGLSKFNIQEESFKNYDVNDGLLSNEFSELASLKRSNGELLFGGVKGLVAFFSNDIYDNKISAETVFTGLSIFNKPVAIGEEVNGRVILDNAMSNIQEVIFKYDENSFSFEFASLHYAVPQKNQYAYKLEGFNKNWISTSSNKRFATYTNLEPGSYTLKVKASNNDGLWDKTPAQLKITVIPPFWKSMPAKVLYAFLFVASLIALVRISMGRSVKKHQLELVDLEKAKHEEIHRLKLEFFTNISHEFRTPLTLIKGPLEYLLKQENEVKPKRLKEQYSMMLKNTDYLLRLVNQLLDFRKMDHGKMNLMVSESDVVQFLNEVGEPFQFLSHKKAIDFKIKSSKKHIITWFDSDALEKIINNLLSNAFKFTPENGIITVDVFEGSDFESPQELEVKEDKSNYIIIQVKDTGPGIPKHRIKHIFERFYIEIDKIKSNSKGTGIGLSFTKALVELHQGSIDVLSDTENGTTFFVWLPKDKKMYEALKEIKFYQGSEINTFISQEDAESHAIGVMDDIVDQNISRSRSNLPVLLVVDDNQDIRMFIKQSLGENYYIYEAENGKQGLELANKFIPNIIITDLMMPVMDGVEFCIKLKTTQETSHIPVIMLTAKMSQEWEIEGLKTGADAYIRKPFDMELLDLKIKNILNHREEMRKRFNREVTLQPSEVTVTSTDEIFLQKAIEIVEKHMTNTEFSVELFVKEMALSRSNLYLKIKELTGFSSSEFIRNIRLKRAMQLLEQSDLTVKEIMYMTGFNTASYFSKCFKKQFGEIPSKYIKHIDLETNSDNTLIS
jgi:signal transduction histidine kinase/ligand-binding sensor domain-containing protein/DNA-binding response OmpR family regulator